MKTAWVTGAGGLIGSALVATAPQRGCRVRGLTRADLDLLNFAAVREAFLADRPWLVIHCAAMSRSPDCKANPPLAVRVNVEVTRFLAELSAEAGSALIFFSSDLVFDGRQGGYREEATRCPLSVYAQTKMEAEDRVLTCPGHAVIRTSLNGGRSPTGDRGFNEQLRRAWQAGRKVRLFADEYRSPIAAVETARATWGLAAQGATGVWHVAGRERLSRLDIGRLLAAHCRGLNPLIEQGLLSDYQGEARSPDTSLDCSKAEKFLKTTMPCFSEWLARQPEGAF